MLTIKTNDNWTFLIFFVFTIVFPLELETSLYYLSINITTDTSLTQIGCSRTRKQNSITFLFFKTSLAITTPCPLPPRSIIMTHCVQKSICNSPINTFKTYYYSSTSVSIKQNRLNRNLNVELHASVANETIYYL